MAQWEREAGGQWGWTFQPLWRHWSGWEEGSEERVGCRDQGVCKEDVSWRLGLSYTIRSKTRGFLSQSHHLWNAPPPCFVVYFITRHLFSKVFAIVFTVGSQLDVFFFCLLCIVVGLPNRQVCARRATRLLAGAKVHHGQWPEGPPVHCAVSQPVPAHQLLK